MGADLGDDGFRDPLPRHFADLRRRRNRERDVLPWDDPEIDRESGLALFDVFASEEKTLHAFPGSHFHVPTDRIDTRFFARQLGVPAPAGAATNAATRQGIRPAAVNELRRLS